MTDDRTADAVILTGTGRYADPWHPYERTSAALAEIVRAAGFTPRIATDVDDALARLDERVRLIVVNAGDPDGPDADDSPEGDGDRPEGSRAAGRDAARVEAAVAVLDAAVARGVGILAVHAAAASLRDYPAYERALGARWVRGRSWHPDFGPARVLVDSAHPLATGISDFTVEDERYTDLRLDVDVDAVAEHEHEGTRHPLVWAREVGRSRVAYDALGHDLRSYESADHRALLQRLLHWLGGASVG
jgi:hypothetical protein